MISAPTANERTVARLTARLIDADALLYEYCQANGCNEVIDEVCSNCFMASLIADAPTVDAVEVVRCRDCRHWNPETGFCNLNSHFSMDGLDWDMFNDDDFCSQGERRTDGQAEDDRAV